MEVELVKEISRSKEEKSIEKCRKPKKVKKQFPNPNQYDKFYNYLFI